MVHILLLSLLLLSPVVLATSNVTELINEDLLQLENVMKTSPEEGEVLFGVLQQKRDELNNQQLARLLMVDTQRQLLLGNFEEALRLLDQVQSVAKETKLLTQSYMYKVTAYMGLRNYSGAFVELEKNLARIESYDELELKLESYLRISNVYLDMGAFEESKLISEKIISLNKKRIPKSHCYGLVGLGYSQLSLLNYDKANEAFIEADSYCEQHKFTLVGAMAVKGLGEIDLNYGRYTRALENLNIALEVYQSFNFHYELSRTYSLLAETYLQLNNAERADEFAQVVNALPNDAIYMTPKKKASEVLSILASRESRYKEAYQHQVHAHALGLQILDEKKMKENAYQMVKFDSAEKTRELNKLVQDHEMIAKQRSMLNNEKSASFMFSTVLAGTVALLALLLYTAWNQRNQFRKQAQVDSLTGLFNRGAGLDKAENELIQVQARGGSYSIIVIDLDWFKKINDSFGHATGDWALKKVSETILELKRNSDIVCRLGGEEFAIFMPFTDMALAQEVAQNLCKAFAEINTRYSGHQFTITGSFGVSEISQDDLSLDPIINRADAALYQAKSDGRNRVVCH